MAEPSLDEVRWLARIKELEWRAELAQLVLAGDTAALAWVNGLAKICSIDPSLGTSTDDVFAGYLNELERLCNAATPEPWIVDDATLVDLEAPGGRSIATTYNCPTRLEDAEFIAAARHALPKLITKVRQLQAELDYYRDEAGEDDHG